MSPCGIKSALAGNRAEMAELVQLLLPCIRAEVGVALFRHSGRLERDCRQELADFVQDAFLSLLDNDGRILRSWEPDRGRSLESFVRFVIRRRMISALRSPRKNPWIEDATTLEEFDLLQMDREDPGRIAVRKQELSDLWQGLNARLDHRGRILLRMIYVEQCSIEETQMKLGMTRDAVYAWKNRLKKIVGELREGACYEQVDG